MENVNAITQGHNNIASITLSKINCSQFPLDVLEEIFCRLDGKSLINCKRVCVNWKNHIEYLEQKTKLWYRNCQNEIQSWEQLDILDNMFPSHWKDFDKINWKEVYKCWCFWSYLDATSVVINKFSSGLTNVSSVQVSGECILITTKDARGKLFSQRFCEETYSCIYVCFGPILNFELVNSDVILSSNLKPTGRVEEIFDKLEHEEIWLELEDCYVQLGRNYCYTINKVLDIEEEREQKIRHSYGYEVRLVDESLNYDPPLYFKKICAKVNGPETMKINLPELYMIILDFWNNIVTVGNLMFPHQLIVSTVTVDKVSQDSSHADKIGHAYAVVNTFVYSWHGSLFVLYSNRDVIIGKDGFRHNQRTPRDQGCVTSVLYYSKHLFIGTEKGLLLIYHVKAPEDCLKVVVYQTPSWNIQVCQGEIIRIVVAEPVHHKGTKPKIVCATAEAVYLVSMESLSS